MAAPATVVDALAKQLRKSASGAWEIPSDALLKMQQQTVNLAGRGLYDAIGSLLRFATFLTEKLKSPRAGEAVIRALKPLVERLEMLATSDSQAIAASQEHLGKEKKSLHKKTATAAALGAPPKRGVSVGPAKR